jgi:hypothetical protein
MNAETVTAEREFFRQGQTDKWVEVKKDGFTLTEADLLTTDGHIKQSALKGFLFLNSMKKAHETVREHLVSLVNKGYKANGELMASISTSAPKAILDKDMLEGVLKKHGYTVEQFYKKGKAPERLIVE